MQNMSKLFKRNHQIHNSPVNKWKNFASRSKSIKLCVEVKNLSDAPAGPSSWVFYRPEWVSIGKKKVLILYTVRKFIKNWTNINERVRPENGLGTSYSHLKILKIRLFR